MLFIICHLYLSDPSSFAEADAEMWGQCAGAETKLLAATTHHGQQPNPWLPPDEERTDSFRRVDLVA